MRAAIEKGTEQRKELYTFLTDCFMDADADRDGFVNSEELDFLTKFPAWLSIRLNA